MSSSSVRAEPVSPRCSTISSRPVSRGDDPRRANATDRSGWPSPRSRATALTINLIDAPGFPDFVGELRAGLRAADAAIFVISAADDIDGATALLWQELAAVGVPRAVAVSKLDMPRSDYDDTIARCQRAFGDAQALYLPVHDAEKVVVGSMGLLSQRVFDSSDGSRVERDPDGDEAAAIEDRRGPLIEAIIEESEDDTLLDRYLEGEDISTETVIEDLKAAVAKATFFPLVPISPADRRRPRGGARGHRAVLPVAGEPHRRPPHTVPSAPPCPR